MRIIHRPYAKTCCCYLLLAFAVFILSACNTRESQLVEREAKISARESELVSLLSELVEQKKLLEKNDSENLPEAIQNSAEKTCSCDSNPDEETIKKPPDMTEAKTKTLLGDIENIFLDPPGMEFSARIDTGAQTSSLNALDIVEFERDGKPFVKFNIIHPLTGEKLELTRRLRRHVRIKGRGGRESHRRPVVKIRVVLADIDEQINFTLEDRSRFKHQILIGRNLLQDLAIVDVSRRNVATPKTENSDTTGKIK
ncbi:RimK/LysX family protein [uncultured Nitrosomonas sp.]|uniref:ATP-dependent zinc protease family protein n=1 Tax=uncultured Nitrosomonas sp. TaxID=156424 RepID=UPI0025FF8401|nr:RimK/LysX family protein [uncultured Nitrosomonas sp.]